MLNLESLNGTAWLVEPGSLKRLLLRLRGYTSCPMAADLRAEFKQRLESARNAGASAVGERGKAVGVLPIYGIIEKRVTGEMQKLGGVTTGELAMGFRALRDDPNIGSIVLDIDSPGGTVQGIRAVADMIFAARQTKPIYAVANAEACSAAYWIGTQASKLYVELDGMVGSVGVFTMHVDESAALEEEGIKITVVSAGKYKAEGASFLPLAAETKKWLQEEFVNPVFTAFVDAVARGRGVAAATVISDYGEGRVVMADKAFAAGMVDGVKTLDEVIDSLLGGVVSASPRRAVSRLTLRLRHEQRKRAALDTAPPISIVCP